MAGAFRVAVFATTLIFANAQNDIESTPADAKLLEEHPGCFHHRFRWTPDIEGTKTTVKSLAECQSLCRNNITGCSKIGYWPATGKCFFGSWTAHLVPAPSGGVAGHADCTEVELDAQKRAACAADEVPLQTGFPAKTLVGSHKLWPSGRQPWSLECWPVTWQGGYVACSSSALASTKDGWVGQCKDLVRQYDIGPNECAQDCYRNPLCPSYQVTKNGECWQGMGRDCDLAAPGEEPLMAERLQHGEIREFTSLVGKQVLGLSKAFDNWDHHIHSYEQATLLCKQICWSDIQCQFWQYAPKYGCWVEDQSTGVRPLYPLTDDSVLENTAFAQNVIAGGYIQHTCEESQTTVWPTQAPQMSTCMKAGVRYIPDLPLMRSIQANAAMCQSRCSENDLCYYFSFWPDGSCYQQGKDATTVTAEDPNVISGPQTCVVDFSPEAQKALANHTPGVHPTGFVPKVDIDPHAFDPPADANGVVQPPEFPTTTTTSTTPVPPVVPAQRVQRMHGVGGAGGEDLGGEPQAHTPAPSQAAARGLGNFWLCALVIPVVLAALAAFWYASRKSKKSVGEADYSPGSSTGFTKLESSPGYSDSESGGEPATPPQTKRQTPPPPPAALSVGQTPQQMVSQTMMSGAPKPAGTYSSATSLVTMAASPEPSAVASPAVVAAPAMVASPPMMLSAAQATHQRQLSATSARASAIAAAVSAAQPLPPLLSESNLFGGGASVSGISPSGMAGGSVNIPNYADGSVAVSNFGAASASVPNFGASASVPNFGASANVPNFGATANVPNFGGGSVNVPNYGGSAAVGINGGSVSIGGSAAVPLTSAVLVASGPASPQRLAVTNAMGARGTPAFASEPMSASPVASAPLAFDAMDRNHDGVITREEFEQALGQGAVQPQAMFR